MCMYISIYLFIGSIDYRCGSAIFQIFVVVSFDSVSASIVGSWFIMCINCTYVNGFCIWQIRVLFCGYTLYLCVWPVSCNCRRAAAAAVAVGRTLALRRVALILFLALDSITIFGCLRFSFCFYWLSHTFHTLFVTCYIFFCCLSKARCHLPPPHSPR